MNQDDNLSEARRQSAEARNEFCDADKAGREALERHDYATLSRAVAAESDAIKKHQAAIERLGTVHPTTSKG